MRLLAYSSPLRLVAALGLLAVSGILGSATGCGGTYAVAICDPLCDCEKCSQTEYDLCVKNLDDSDKVAEDAGCGREKDAFYGCVADRGQCIGRDYKIGGCDLETKEFVSCLVAAKCDLRDDATLRCK